MQHGLVGVEDPLPLGDTVHPRGGFVGRDDRRGQQFGLDHRAGRVERRPHPPEAVGDGAFGDGQASRI